MNDLTVSNIERQNVLNNRYAVDALQENLGFTGMLFEGEYRFTKKMVADFYEVDISTIDRYLSQYADELKYNGYVLSRGKQLKEFKLQFGHLINEATKTTQLGLFNFRAVLNVGMLLTESEKAKQVRARILDIVIATINKRAGGGTKYINTRDIDFLPAAIEEDNYRKNFTSAVGKCVQGHKNFKYAQVTDLIYQAIFKEKAREYRALLRLDKDDNVRRTLYAEVLRCISSFENGIGFAIEAEYKANGGMQLTLDRVKELIAEQEQSPAMQPFIYDARTKMASRDVAFRDVFHNNIAGYLRAVTPEEFDRFIGEKSIDFNEIMNLPENKAVLKRLKQADDDE
ncbi:MAG: DNA-binding protein [Muribaculaceae bacterium]|nr:DNA-binding protein [Muribaculaceae bacterium]